MNDSNQIQLTELFSKVLSAVNASNWQSAEFFCKKILLLHPDHPDAIYMLGLIYQNTGDNKLASSYYKRVLFPSNSYTDALNNLGTIHESDGDTRKALTCYKKAVQSNPSHFLANYNLGRISRVTGDTDTAITALNAALRSESLSIPVLIELGITLKTLGRYQEALSHLARASSLAPDNPVVYNILGNIHHLKSEIRNAISCYSSAIQIKPGYAEALNNLGSAYVAMGNVTRGLKYYRKAVKARPDWNGAISNLLLAENYLSNCQEDLFSHHKKWGDSLQPPTIRPPQCSSRPRDKIRIGLVSPDFRAHSVAWFLMAILLNYNRDSYDVTCFSDTAAPDNITKTIMSLVDNWQNISGFSDEDACRRIRESDIDLLIDLAGHTAGNRLGVFALQPCPIQVSYLGYPNTTGLDTIKYRITDTFADPVGAADLLHTEKLIRLPYGFLCYTPGSESPAPSGAPCVINGYITFGCFNVLAKLSEECIMIWSAILQQTVYSRLILKSAGLEDPDTRSYICNRFMQHGIDPRRIEMLPRTNDLTSHLRQYSRIDIALDTLPYNGTTTTCEALWMGVPVISLCGNRHAGRVGLSLLAQIGLEELVADGPEEYISIAEDLAHDQKKIVFYRTNLRNRMQNSPLCDGPVFTRSLENALNEML
jgi:protein O-GlcNAc transferase